MKCFFTILLGLATLSSLSQNNSRKLEIGLFIGEGTGILVNKPISNNLSLEFNAGINELFLDYKFIQKYEPSRINQEYDNIFNFSVNLIYQKTIKPNSPFIFRGGIGWQNRFVTNYKYELNPLIFPNWAGTTGPYRPLTINYYFGLNYFAGIGYKIKANLTSFIDVGGYSEVFFSSGWSNPQFRVGLKYQFKEK